MSTKNQRNLKELYKKIARKVLSESLQLKKGETVTVETWNNGVDFAREILLEARRLGSIPLMLLEDEEAYLNGIRAAPKDIVGSMGRHEYALLEKTDAYVFIPGPPVGGYTKKITGKEYTDSIRYNASWYESAKKAKLRGVRMSFGYAGDYLARMLNKSTGEIVRHQLLASLADFDGLRQMGVRLSRHMKDGSEATLTSDGAKLTFQLKGEVEIQDGVTDQEDVSAGNNMSYVPPGFLLKEIDPSSVSGSLNISPSTTRLGMIHDATIRLKEGSVTEYSSRSSKRVLGEVFEIMRKTGGKVSYVTIGLNPLMQHGFGQDRFVEGTLTLTLGFGAIIRNGDLTVDGEKIISKGCLSIR